MNAINETKGDGLEEPRRDTGTQDSVAIAKDVEEIYKSIQELFELATAGIVKMEDAGPEEMPWDASQEDVTANDTECNSSYELLKEPAIEKSAVEEIYETAGGSPEEPLRDTAALEDRRPRHEGRRPRGTRRWQRHRLRPK